MSDLETQAKDLIKRLRSIESLKDLNAYVTESHKIRWEAAEWIAATEAFRELTNASK